MTAPEERGPVATGLSEADRRFLAAAEAEDQYESISAGWRPWMGPRPEPTPEQRAARDAADAESFQRFLAAAEGEPAGPVLAGWPGPPDEPPADLSDALRRAADARPGEPVHLRDPATDRRFVLLPAEVYDRLVRAG
ncbi:MAG: hypothetical protein K2X82_25110 [Gemmataceae bacterium]|nr:hypothetical protein [Gemmataceae bacterium]